MADDETILEQFKYAQVGRCVNSVTHDVNNYLGAILAYAELVSLDPSTTDDSKRMLNDVVSAVRKSTDLMSTLTSIARPERTSSSLVDIASLVEQTVDLRRYEMRIAQIEVVVKLEGETGLLVVDEPKIVRAMMYLLMNSVDALADAESGTVNVTIVGEKSEVSIRVSDTGGAIDAAVQEKMFEPSYTTKETGHLGLGLSEARAIARLHKGDLTYDSETGFTMRLPRDTGVDA